MEIFNIEAFLILLLLVATLVGILTKRLKMPYTVGLVIVGLALVLIRPGFLEIDILNDFLVPEIILSILVPALVFEAAFHIKFDELRTNMSIITAFAIPGVILTMLLVGGAISWMIGLPFEVALVFGSLIAATDPVAVVALFRSLGVPKRLQILLEGESLFNDGTAIVLYTMTLSVVATGEFSISQGILDFFKIAGGGLLVGILLSYLLKKVIYLINDSLIEITLTIIAAYGSYLIAEEFHLSGVLAVVAAGLSIGNMESKGMSPTTRIVLVNFWQYATYLANTLVFLLIGLVIDLRLLVTHWQGIILAIVIVLLARAVVIYSFSRFIKSISKNVQHVLYWGGLRGAISLALALSLPVSLGRENLGIMQAMAFGVVLFTLIIQGVTMEPLIKRLKFIQKNENKDEYARRQARAVAAQSAFEHLHQMTNSGLISEHTWNILESPLRKQAEARSLAVGEILKVDPSVELTELHNAFRENLTVQRNTYSELLSNGVIDEDVFTHLVSEIDTALLNDNAGFTTLIRNRSDGKKNITRLLIAVISWEDLENAITTLNLMGFPVTEYSGRGTGQDNVALLIGMEKDQENTVVDILCSVCAETADIPVGFIQNLFPGIGQKATIHNVDVYIFDIDYFEEF
ncbi:MAG: Na+/H+ antiporter [Anaerolineales bacterium]|nr:Na+/H+ antiporter [Anaerolineales bacterium]